MKSKFFIFGEEGVVFVVVCLYVCFFIFLFYIYIYIFFYDWRIKNVRHAY
jgi:hypothetical protein